MHQVTPMQSTGTSMCTDTSKQEGACQPIQECSQLGENAIGHVECF